MNRISITHKLLALLALTWWAALPRPTLAAETYHTCAGFITSVPTTISTQGVYCLSQDIATALISGAAITIATNNVTIDCNDFKIGGLAAGAGTSATGVAAEDRLNATVRHCNIRGFAWGVYFYGSAGGGHILEDNRFDGNTFMGLRVEGDGSVVRRNLVRDTGGASSGVAFGIFTVNAVDVLDNTVSGVLPIANADGDGNVTGIHTESNINGSVSGNRVRGLMPLDDGTAKGITNTGTGRISLDGNHVVGVAGAGNIGMSCSGTNNSGRAMGNIVNGFATGISGCRNDGNVTAP